MRVVAGTANATFAVFGTAAPSLAASTDFKGSDGIVQLNAAAVTATVPAGGTATNNCTRFLISVPADGDSASGTSNWNVAEINSSGTVAKSINSAFRVSVSEASAISSMSVWASR